MKETNYWQQFLSTGSIQDYLEYRQEYNGKAAPQAAFAGELGENSYAGICRSDRDGSQDGAYRGL